LKFIEFSEGTAEGVPLGGSGGCLVFCSMGDAMVYFNYTLLNKLNIKSNLKLMFLFQLLPALFCLIFFPIYVLIRRRCYTRSLISFFAPGGGEA
jgi:hypothetical protein